MSDKKKLATMSDPAIPRNSSESVMGKMNKIFNTLKAHYPQYHSTIKNDAQESEMLKVWAKDLISGNVTEGMLRIGMSCAKAHAIEDKFCKWPSIGDFILWCHGIPSPEAAYYETVRNCHDLTEWEPSHPIVALAGREVTFVAIRHSEDKRSHKTEYIRVYADMCMRVTGGEAFEYRKKEKPLAIESKPKSEEELERGRQKLEELKAIVAGGDENQKNEEKPLMTEEEKQKRMADMRVMAAEWKASRGDK